ncbi:uncharacterized protein LOC134586222 [Pelobates fuscus]|uniref:uncharacterized protein LOC134586222 n=1 Tax=Pelobates fuscus TaxID=191477 RepID=UPI002FE4B565
MSVTRAQPSPFGQLRREKHIDHIFRISTDEKMVCSCLEVRPVQTFNQYNDFTSQEEKHEKHKNEKLTRPKNITRKETTQVTTSASPSDKSSEIRPMGDKPRIQRMLTAVEELDESTSSELQILAGDKQFFITSKVKPQGLRCQPERLYIISTRTAKQLLVATEDSSFLCFHLCGPARSCSLQLCDQNREEVLRFCRPYRMDVCCLFCCLMVIRVFSSTNSPIGSVQQR